ncbi:hypothetical protein GH714_022001 [Hevea brasiliensis]|uniref:Leucine-rich repeat-containing N-terminal plant-type domain-containing protein n=1 Tax=Hevea brasiliensis TaxID=3981 RepID=A0A6A6N1P3_HEVBR|nr:hypothetical protein GH714_022001 [Hevea brasiliensis]
MPSTDLLMASFYFISHFPAISHGTENVEAISFRWDGRDIGKPLKLSATAFAKMCNLRFIEVCALWTPVLVPKNFEFCAQALRCLCWDYYPLESLPLNFWPKNLVELHMTSRKLIHLWNGGDKPLENLKLMDLSYSRNLIRIPDLSSTAPNLEFLYLNYSAWKFEINGHELLSSPDQDSELV